MKNLLIILSVLFFTQSYASHLIDSLRAGLNNQKDTLQVALLDELSWQYGPINSDSAIYFGEQALALAQQLGFEKGEAQAYSELGVAYYYGGNSGKAISYFTKALELKRKRNQKYEIAAMYNMLAVAHIQLAKYKEALYYNLLSLRLFEEVKNEQAVATAYNNIGLIYYDLEDTKKSLFYFLKALEKQLKLKSKTEIGTTYTNIGNVYNFDKNYSKALTYYLMAIPLLEHSDNLHYTSGLFNNIGNIYVYLKKPNKAIHFLTESIAIRQTQEDNKGLAYSYMNMADAYQLLGNKKLEAEYLEKSIQASEKLGALKEVAVANQRYANSLIEHGDYQKAVIHLKKYIEIHDSIFSDEVATATADMQTKYETEKKEIENKLLLQENEINTLELQTKRTQIVLLGGLLAVVLLVGFLFYTRYKHKKEQELITTKIYAEQQRLQSMIATQEEERKRISGELHDGIGQMLSVVRMNLSVIEQPDGASKINQTIGLLDDACNELRAISHQLMPAVLINKGISGALAELISNLSKASKLHIDYYADSLTQLTPEQEIHLFRVIQELLNNAVKYAEATELHLTLHVEDNLLKVMVSDNGKGFDTNLITSGNGNGWHNISTRIRLLNGAFEVDSAAKQGTSVFIEIPIIRNSA